MSVSLTWDQVNAWRLAQHHLLERAKRADMLDVVSHLCGLHAQLMPAAELALWARVEAVSPTDLTTALWDKRSLVKTWVMRGTLHVLTAAEFPLYVAARSGNKVRRPPSYFTYHGVTPAELEAIIAGVRSTLTATGMTREQLADAIAAQARNPRLAEVLRSGWGSLLKPSAAQGDVCYGPNQGQNVTFVRPEHWLENWRSLEPQPALQEVARRYLTAYGPATTQDFARWWGFEPAEAKRLFRSLGDEIEAVEVEGWPAWALASTLTALDTAQAGSTVNLLPGFDPYTVAFCRHPAILPEVHKALVSRPQGWISPVVLVEGRMAGVWEYESRRALTMVQVTMFNPPAAETRQRLEAEVAQLGPFLGTDIEVSYG